MDTRDIISSISTLNEQQLELINSAVVDQLKAVRRRKASIARHIFSVGDNVKFGEAGARGKRSLKIGKLTRIKRTRAEVLVENTTWTVPLSMLTAA